MTASTIFSGEPRINNNGRVVYDTVNSTDRTIRSRIAGGSSTLVAESGSGEEFSGFQSSNGPPFASINNNDVSVFRGFRTTGGIADGIFAGTPSARLIISDTNQDGFSSYGNAPDINDAGNAAFTAVSSGIRNLYIGSDGATPVVLADGSVFASLSNASPSS